MCLAAAVTEYSVKYQLVDFEKICYALDDEVLSSLLLHYPRPEVLLCSNNHLALHCLQHIRRLGLRIPEDIALLTFGNYPFSILTDPAITAVEVDMHDM